MGTLSKIVRVRREDSAFVYAVFESLEGMVSVSTVNFDQLFCDLSLEIPDAFVSDMESVLEGLRKKMPIIELTSSV